MYFYVIFYRINVHIIHYQNITVSYAMRCELCDVILVLCDDNEIRCEWPNEVLLMLCQL